MLSKRKLPWYNPHLVRQAEDRLDPYLCSVQIIENYLDIPPPCTPVFTSGVKVELIIFLFTISETRGMCFKRYKVGQRICNF